MATKKYHCKFCKKELLLEVNRHKRTHLDEHNMIIPDNPVVWIDSPYYDCSGCGSRWTTKEIEGKWREDKVVDNVKDL